MTWVIQSADDFHKFFNQLLTIISSLFSVWFTFGLCGVMWFYDIHPLFAKNDESRTLDTPMKKFLYICSIIAVRSQLPLLTITCHWTYDSWYYQIVLSVATGPLGLYSAAESIKAGVRCFKLISLTWCKQHKIHSILLARSLILLAVKE